MSLPVKAALGGGALAALGGAGIWALATSGMPKWTSLEKENSSLEDTKYGKKYARYLVGHAKEENDAWWKWSFGNRYFGSWRSKKDENNHGFSSLSSYTMLKEACKAAYEGSTPTNEGKIAVTTGSETKNYDEGQLWMLCSPLGEKPTTIKEEKEESNYTNKKASGKESDLISVKEGKNEMFWHARNGEFYGKDGFEKITVDSSHTHFHTEQSKGEKGKTIRELCKEAYEMASSGEGSAQSPTQDQIVKYCSVDLKGTTAATPSK